MGLIHRIRGLIHRIRDFYTLIGIQPQQNQKTSKFFEFTKAYIYYIYYMLYYSLSLGLGFRVYSIPY